MIQYGVFYQDPEDNHIEDDYFEAYPEAEEQAIFYSKHFCPGKVVYIWENETETDVNYLIAEAQEGRVVKRYKVS